MRSFRKCIFSAGLMLLALPLLFAQINPAQVMPVDPKVKIGRLSNGLTYYIRHNAKPEQRAELRLVVNAGSVLEDEDQLGLAHFMEHMNFNGTKRFPKNELVNYLQSIGVEFGADLNAYTSFDETIYILPVPVDKPGLLEKGLQILEDWAHNASLDSLEIEKERGVVIEEWRLSRGADERMMKQTLPVQYMGSKYASRLPIGSLESLQHFSHDALKRFYKDWYRPDLQAIIVVGDIDINDIEQKIKETFSDIPAPLSPRKREIFPVPDHEESLSVVAKDKETAFPSVQVMYKKEVLPQTSIADYCRYIHTNLFTGMLNTRFREMTVSVNPPFVSAGSFFGNSYARSKDAYQLYASSSDTGMARTLAALLKENRRVLLHGFTMSELELQKKQLLSFYENTFKEREKEESYRYADEYINNFLLQEPIPGIEWEYDFVKQYLTAVTLDDINRLAKSWITEANRVVTLNAPEKQDVNIPSAEMLQSILLESDRAVVQPYQEKIMIRSLMDSSAVQAGKIAAQHSNEKLGTVTYRLSNGALVIVKPTAFKNDEILFRAFSKGGHSLVPDEEYYSASYAASIIAQSGLGGHSFNELSNFLKGKNTRLSPGIGAYSESLSGSTAPAELETLLQMAHLYFTNPGKDEEAFQSFKTRQKQFYSNASANPQIYFNAEVQKLLTQNHKRGGGLPLPEHFDQINLEHSWKFFRERFSNAADFTFLIVGAVDEEKLRPLLEKYLASLPGHPKKEKYKDLGIRPPLKMIDTSFYRGADPKSAVNFIFVSAPGVYNPSDHYALRSLGEIMDIRLIENLREEKGGVYGAGAYGTMYRVPYAYSSFSMSFPCAPENTDTLSKAALNELKQIIQNGVKPADLEKIKEQQKRKLEVDLKENNFWLNSLFEAYYYGEKPETILEKEKQIEKLTSRQIQDAAKKYINTRRFIRVVLQPEKEGSKKPF